MSYKVYKKNVNKYSKKVPGENPGNQTQSVYLFTGRSITPDKKQIINIKSASISGRPSGASTDRPHNLNRNLSLTAITGTSVPNGHSRNITKKDRMSGLKSKGSISSSSSYNQHASNTKVASKTFRNVTNEENDNDPKLIETVKLLKNENKKLLNLLKESEKTLTDKLKDARKEMEKMTTIINQLWPFIQTHLKRELGSEKLANLK